MSREQQKQKAAEAALAYVKNESVVGVGTGSTVNYFIDALADLKNKIEGTVASSNVTAKRLKERGLTVFDLNNVNEVGVYVDGADEVNDHLQMIKGGGGALTREKILAAVAKQFICIADEGKLVPVLGSENIPIPVEVIPMARSYVAREIIKLGGFPTYREGFITDNDNIILDIYHLSLTDPVKIEQALNNIAGVVCNGIFAHRSANTLLIGTSQGVKTLNP